MKENFLIFLQIKLNYPILYGGANHKRYLNEHIKLDKGLM